MTDVRTTELPCYIIGIGLLSRVKTSNATNFKKAFRHAGRLFETARLRQTKSSLFVSFFLCFIARLRENGWTDLHEIFREGAERPWDDLIQFWVKSEKPRNVAMRNTGPGFVVLSDHSLLTFFLKSFP